MKLSKKKEKENVYKKLVAKVNDIHSRGFVLKTKYDTDKSDLEKRKSDTGKKIPDTSELVKKADCSAKIAEIKGKIFIIFVIDFLMF